MIYFEMLFIAIIGTLLHFVYEMSNHNKFVAIFSAVNESTWEHIKICMTPTILCAFYDLYIYGVNSNIFIAESLRILTIMLLIPILFYTYTAFTKKAILFIDVICFYITIVCSSFVFDYYININTLPFIFNYISCILLFVELACYFILTFKPIKNFVFKDPISKKYGLLGHTETHHHDHK